MTIEGTQVNSQHNLLYHLENLFHLSGGERPPLMLRNPKHCPQVHPGSTWHLWVGVGPVAACSLEEALRTSRSGPAQGLGRRDPGRVLGDPGASWRRRCPGTRRVLSLRRGPQRETEQVGVEVQATRRRRAPWTGNH